METKKVDNRSNYNLSCFDEVDAICFTTDLDWAPEIAIERTISFFQNHKIIPTVFVTHFSKVIEEHREQVDLGIHPNFIQPSSQGENLRSILDFCQSIVPDTNCFRCHRWYSSNDIYDELWKRGFKYESNICTNMDLLRPFEHRSGMICFPAFFEDGAFIQKGFEIDYKNVVHNFRQKGLKVINIHPMHYALNTPYFKYTRDIKDSLTREEWNGLTQEALDRIIYRGMGIRSLIEDIVHDALERGAEIVTLNEAYKRVSI